MNVYSTRSSSRDSRDSSSTKARAIFHSRQQGTARAAKKCSPQKNETQTTSEQKYAEVRMVMKMPEFVRVTFEFCSSNDDSNTDNNSFQKDVGDTFLIDFHRVILSEKFVSEDDGNVITGNVIVHEGSPAYEHFKKYEPNDVVLVSTSDYNDETRLGEDSFPQNDVTQHTDLSKGAKTKKIEHFEDNSSSFFASSVSIVPDETPQCFVEHPGIISCTKRLIKEIEDGSFELWLKTKVFKAIDSDKSMYDSITKRGLIAIGAKALEEEAKLFSDKCRNEAVDETTYSEATELAKKREETHIEIMDVLKNGDIVNCVSLAKLNSFGHPLYKLRLRCKETGKEIDCMFKPKIDGDGQGWHRVLMEVVAYKLNRILGMDYIPPAFYRMNRKGPPCSRKDKTFGDNPIQCDYKKFEEGAFIYWAQQSQTLKEVNKKNWKMSQRELLSDTRVMDVLLGNVDRHHGHFLFAEHWVDAKPIPKTFRNEICNTDTGERTKEPQELSEQNKEHNNNNNNDKREDEFFQSNNHYPVLIDHAAAFRDGAYVDMTHENAFQTGPTVCISAKTYFRLRLLDARAIAREFEGLLTTSECRRLLSRRNDLLWYLDNLVAKKGYENVIIL